MQVGQIRTEVPIAWVDWWVDEKVTALRNTKLLESLNTDFTEENCGGGGRI